MKNLCLPILGVFTKSFSLLFFLVFFLLNPELVFASEEERTMFAKGRDPSETPDWSVESNQDSAYFGVAVSTAGDVNGDGYSDVIVGAYLYDNGETDEGRAYVYHGGSSGPSGSPDWVGESDQANAHFGRYVSYAGDVNGDGYSDVIVSAYRYDNGETDEGRVYVYHGSSSGLSSSPDWVAESNQPGPRFGRSVSAGDVNGDGYSDVIVGAYLYDHGQTDEGRVYVYHGSSSGLSSSPDWTAESNQAYAYFGYSVSAGDVNGDGYSDVIVGACYYDNGETNEGGVFVYHGSSSGLSSSPDWVSESDKPGACFGVCVSTAGDVNGDGYSDVIVGAYRYTNGETNEGGAYVYNGSSSGLSSSPSWVYEPNQADVYFGYSVSSAGDVNGDGYSDVIVGAYGYDNGETDEGRVYVYHGDSSGLSSSPDWVSESNQVNSGFGGTVSTAGDVNGDGYFDVIVGSAGYDNGETDEGMAFLYFSDNSGIEDYTNSGENTKLSVFPSISINTFEIKFSISEEETQEEIYLSVYNKVGMKIANLFTGNKAPGVYTVKWHGNSSSSEPLSNDMYFISLKKGKKEQLVRKILLMR